MLRRLWVALVLAATPALADWPAAMGDRAPWDAAYDAARGTRFVPLELVLPHPWDGARAFVERPAKFVEASGESWSGPVADRDAETDLPIAAYLRERRDRVDGEVVQRFALRKEGDGFGRVYDSRFGGIACSGEIKFPLGLWKEGEVRRNEFTCRGPGGRATRRVNTIAIERLDFPCRGVEHCLQFRWLHEMEGRGAPLDHRRYVLAPGLGLVVFDRLR